MLGKRKATRRRWVTPQTYKGPKADSVRVIDGDGVCADTVVEEVGKVEVLKSQLQSPCFLAGYKGDLAVLGVGVVAAPILVVVGVYSSRAQIYHLIAVPLARVSVYCNSNNTVTNYRMLCICICYNNSRLLQLPCICVLYNNSTATMCLCTLQ